MSEKRKNKAKNSDSDGDNILPTLGCIVAFVILSVMVMVAVPLMLFVVPFGMVDRYRGDEAVSKIAQYIQPTLPDSVSRVHIEVSGWRDPVIDMRFRIPPEDAERWLISTGLCTDIPEEKIDSYLNKDFNPDWWQEENWIDGKIQTSCATYNVHDEIEIDISNPEYWSFFIHEEHF